MSKFIFIKSVNLTPSTSYLFKSGTVVSGKTVSDTRPDMNGGYTTITYLVFNSGGLDFKIALTPSVINPYNQKDKYQFVSSVNLKSITSTSFDNGTVVNGDIVNITRPTPMGGTMIVPTLNFKYNGLDFSVVVSKNNPVVKPYSIKDISNKVNEYSSNIEGNKIGKYRFKTDYKTYPYYPEGVQPITAGILKEFKKGDVIEGSFFNDNSQSERDYVLINGGYRIPFGGRVSPIEQIITEDLPQRQVDSTKSVLKEKSNSVFTTKNLVISLAVAGLMYGIYTIYKK